MASPAAGTRPDHLFDVDRFGEWIEVLVDTGNSVAARTVAALDENLVVAGLSQALLRSPALPFDRDLVEVLHRFR